MGKRKDTSTEEEAVFDGELIQLPVKKHKKHKHKKHKRKKSDVDVEGKSSILKMAILTPNEDDLDTTSISMSTSQPKPTLLMGSPPKSAKKKKKGKESATSSEEERWLDAIESGKLEEVDDELKKIKPKDPKLMTARQRAMLERKTTDKEPGQGTSGEQLLALPTGYREKVMTPEMALKAALKSQKRKQQADEKREKDKKKTMERLLRKQESKPGKMSGKGRAVRRQVPSVTYCNSQQGITITLPPDLQFPLASVRSVEPPALKTCGVLGCSSPKRYSCSKTGIPLCSLACYKKNITDSRST